MRNDRFITLLAVEQIATGSTKSHLHSIES
jgi:hypothetical protein